MHTVGRLQAETEASSYQTTCLEAVRSKAANITHDAIMLGSYIRSLTRTHPFLTEAEHEMEQAELVLSDALVKVRAARAAYDILPRDDT